MKKLNHIDDKGKVIMVDISHKKDQLRIAKAQGHIKVKQDTLRLIKENNLKKGDVLSISEIAGIQGAKQTGNLIPLCHPLNITKIEVVAKPDKDGILVTSTVKSIGQTGVEMEALTAVSIALLTIYDMCKAVDKKMVIDKTELLEKTKNDIT